MAGRSAKEPLVAEGRPVLAPGPGDLVAVQGLVGLGHLGVQVARAMGFEVAAVSRGAGRAAFAAKHGVEARVEPCALADAQAGYERMMSGDARFRVVLEVA